LKDLTKKNENQQIISKEAILSQAAKMFRERGYQNTTLEDVAVSFGVSRPAIYYYFKSKQEILTNIHRQAREKLYTTAQKIYNMDLPTVEKFQRLIENHIYVVASEATILGIYYEEDKELNADYYKEVQESRRDYTNRLIELYQMGVKEGIFKDVNPTVAVFTVLGTANWVYRWFRETGPLSAKEVAALMSNLLMDTCLINK